MATSEKIQLVGADVIRETEKAYQVTVTIDTACGQRGWNVWLPKSRSEVIEGHVITEEWLIRRKETEIACESFERGGFFGIVYCEIV